MPRILASALSLAASTGLDAQILCIKPAFDSLTASRVPGGPAPRGLAASSELKPETGGSWTGLLTGAYRDPRESRDCVPGADMTPRAKSDAKKPCIQGHPDSL